MNGEFGWARQNPVPVSADVTALSSPGRLAELRQAGLGAAAGPGIEGLARLGARPRQPPLAHWTCQDVRASGSPLLLADAREDERTCDNLAIGDLGVIA